MKSSEQQATRRTNIRRVAYLSPGLKICLFPFIILPPPLPEGEGWGRGSVLLKNLFTVHDVDALLGLVQALTCNVVNGTFCCLLSVDDCLNCCCIILETKGEALHWCAW